MERDGWRDAVVESHELGEAEVVKPRGEGAALRAVGFRLDVGVREDAEIGDSTHDWEVVLAARAMQQRSVIVEISPTVWTTQSHADGGHKPVSRPRRVPCQ